MNDDFIIENGVLIEYIREDEHVVIPDDVTSIAEFAFENFTRLNSVTIQDGVTSIGAEAFFGCENLNRITIPDSVTHIEERAFSNCEKLKSVIIPDSVTSIGKWAFEWCSNLDSITVLGETFQIDDFLHKYIDYWSEYYFESLDGDDREIPDYETQEIRDTVTESILNLLINGTIPEYLEDDIPHRMKYELIFHMLKNKPAHKNFLNMVQEHFSEIFAYLLTKSEENKLEIVQAILDMGFITKDNIDDCIHTAIDNKVYEIQVMLTDYKAKNNWYDDPETIIRKKFDL